MLLLSFGATADPILITNGAVHVVIEPRVFAILDIRLSSGSNWLQPLAVSEELLNNTEWADPGGLVTDILPFEKIAALRRGPAKVLEQTDTSISLEGPRSECHKLWITKTLRLASEAPAATFTVTLHSESATPVPLALRNTARPATRSTLRVDKQDGTIRSLSGDASLGPAVVKSRRYWLIPVPPTADIKNSVLGAFVPAFGIERERRVWTRRLVTMPGSPVEAPDLATFVCVLDRATGSYGAALQGACTEVSKDHPLELTEEWTFE